MHQSRSAVFGPLWIIALALAISGCVAAAAAQEPVQMGASAELQVTLSAPYSTISWDVRDPARQKFELPLLYLHRERQATGAAERTLSVQLSGLGAGTKIQLEAVSQHVNVSTGTSHTETESFFSDRPCTADDPCTIRWTFDATTPSDLYTLRVKNLAGVTLWESRERPAFVALDIWDVELGEYTVRVYYATLFPFARGQEDLDNRLAPAAVTDFIEGQFAPAIQDTWRAQAREWGFGDPLHPDWDRDQVVEIVVNAPPFALVDGSGTYAEASTLEGGRPYPERRLWWRSSLNNFAAYQTLGDAYRAGLAHEFFHLLQWNVRLAGERPIDSWLNVFIEAQACAAVTVQYPELELGQEGRVARHKAYARAANRFLSERLNSSYRELDAHPTERYDAALYWRFLYEQYGDMGVIHAALDEMALYYSPEIVGAMDRAMDAAFARLDGPFHSFEESLVAFAHANYALRLENGRCTTSDLAVCGGLYYDPNQMYVDPPLEAVLDYNGAASTYSGAIPSSYGMDFIDVRLDPTTRDQPLTIRFQGQGEVARFNVQVWQLAPGPWKPRAVTEQPAVMAQSADGAQVYTIPSLDTGTYDRLALIVTRLDADETIDPVGNYRVTLADT